MPAAEEATSLNSHERAPCQIAARSTDAELNRFMKNRKDNLGN